MITPFSILFRYLILEMLPPFIINLAFFSFIFLMKEILDITDMIVNQKVGAGAVFLLLIYMMPYFLQYVIPMSVMMAVLLTHLRMSSDNEVMALKAGGVSIYRLLPPVLAFGLFGMVVTGYMTLWGVPQSAERFKTLLFDVASANLNVSLKERTFNDSFKHIMLYVNRIDPHTGELHHVLIEDSRTAGVNNTVIASRGRLFGEPKEMIYHLRLYDGTINQMNMQDRSSNAINFETYDIRLDLRTVISASGMTAKRPKEMTLTDLRAYLKDVKDNKSAYFDGLLNLHKKFSIPVACLAMGLLALPLGIQSRNAKKAFGIGLGLLFFLLYYLLLSMGTALGENGKLHPALGMWMPNVILGGIGGYLLIRSAKEKAITLNILAPVLAGAIRLVKKKMTIVYRYVTREILTTFFIVLVAVMSIYVAIDFIEKIDNFMEAGVPAGRCLVYLAFKLPFIAVQIAPVGFLLSILIALGLMSKNNEIIALKSCGIGKERVLKPTMVLGLLFCGSLFVTADMVVPVFMANANQIWLQEVRKKNIYASKTNDIWMRAARQIIHIKQYSPEKKRVSGITIHTFGDDFQLVRRIDAESGAFIDGQWQLKNALQQNLDKDSGTYGVDLRKTLAAHIDLTPEDLAQAAKRSDEMGLSELSRYIEKVEREGYGATRYRVDYQSKIASPFVCIFLSVLGTGIALRGKLREGLPVSITYGLAITFLYWIFNSLCLALGYAEMLPPVVAAWMANLVFSCAAGVLLFSVN